MHFPSYRTKDFSNKLRKSSALHISNSPHEQSLSKVSGGKLISRDNVSDLIFRGYHCLERMNADKKRVSDLKRRVKLYFSGSSPESFDTRKVRRESKNESENHGDIVGVDDLDINLEENDIREPLKETTDVPDPCVRPILLPPPGCLGFRHDPVKRYEIYRKNWESNPIPGEEKRLRLRWKIREYMLRREVPSLKVSDLMKPRPPNPEWTPRRYLD
ncbi:hypothetical protein AB6A40_007000 [Gnathostoma spinigerum]|uniref:Centriolar and ciliogenesis-associated protein HYLS1 C-terminal domain-containing protein n=1 Tax=Gnathostoma spinigerum TaxID=75299 RepID=A0ABD6ES62_9BILA